MPDENVDLARRLYQSFIKGDLTAAADLVHPDIELLPPPTSPEERLYKGYDAVRRHLTELTTWIFVASVALVRPSARLMQER